MTKFQISTIVVALILSVWLTWPFGLLLLGLWYLASSMAATERESLRKSEGWVRHGMLDRAQKERTTYKLLKAFRMLAIFAIVVLSPFFIYRLVAILSNGNSLQKVFLTIFVGLLFLLWWSTFVAFFRQYTLNRSLLLLLKSLSLSESYCDLLSEAEECLTSQATLLRGFLCPRKYLSQSVSLARRLVEPFENLHLRQSLSSEQNDRLAEIHSGEMKLLAHRNINQVSCRHLYNYYGPDEEIPFVCLESYTVGNKIESLFWCRYCLLSIRQSRQIPVIVKPPP